MTSLVRYETARAALAEARSVDEVKDIHDKAAAMTAYARMANDTQLEADASELKLRAERRLGVMIAEQKRSRGLNKGGRPKTSARSEGVSVPSLHEMGIDHKLSSRSQKVAGIGEQAFERVVLNVRQRIADQSGRVSLDVTAVDKKEKRSNREKLLAGLQSALPKRKYGVILADPEWRFEPYSRETGMDRAADNHYPTSTTDAICARPVADIAADDCVLFLWATVPMLQEAFYVMEAWGFARLQTPRVGALETLLRAAVESHEAAEGIPANPAHWCARARALLEEEPQGRYVSNFAWGKNRIGNGYWNRNKHEHLLIGVRGRPPAPAMGTQWESLLEAAVGEHSAKPEKFYDLIESYFPNLPKIELNARRARPGWDCWGNEAPENSDSERVTFESIPSPPNHPILNTVSTGGLTGVVHGAPPVTLDLPAGGASLISEDDDPLAIPAYLRRTGAAA